MSAFIYFLLGAMTSWILTHSYHIRSVKTSNMRDNQTKNISKFERSINYIFYLLKKGKWEFQLIDNRDCYVCQDDPSIKIDCSDEGRPFSEPWTDKLPDKSARLFYIKILKAGDEIKAYPFVNADGGRYTVPLPEVITDSDGKRIFFWQKNSPQYHIANIVEDFYREPSLEKVANFLGVDLIEERKL
jgi:hypothetical protein